MMMVMVMARMMMARMAMVQVERATCMFAVPPTILYRAMGWGMISFMGCVEGVAMGRLTESFVYWLDLLIVLG